jgi:hypothetical protein
LQYCGWQGNRDSFLGTPNEEITSDLSQFHHEHCNEGASPEQLTAWINCLDVLKTLLSALDVPVHVIFEYLLPREQGRRPDVIFLFEGYLFVLEFKDYHRVGAAHIDQAQAYARDLHDYHNACTSMTIAPLLILTRAGGLIEHHGEVMALGPESLREYLGNQCRSLQPVTDAAIFLEGDYEPLPTLISSAQLLFNNEPLPQIHKASSAGVPETVAFLQLLASNTAQDNINRLVLVTGVPGAGKTLVGLQFVYDASSKSDYSAIFLSGNGPLVKVLQYTLKSRVFVQSLHGFLKQYGGQSSQIPAESVWFYDEAQRAWDDNTAMKKRGANSVSEPRELVGMADRTSKGVMLVGLVGEGQEIHIGEEAGIGQWADAVAASPTQWKVYCPKHVVNSLERVSSIETDERLNLDKSLRTHRASDLQEWVEQLLEGKLDQASELISRLHKDGYPIYITRDIRSAKKHVVEKYRGFIDKRYGLLASSKARNLPRHGVNNGFGSVKDVGAWFADSPDSSQSCCQLAETATEFSCQGLELDMPIVAWGNDLLWNRQEGLWHKFEERSAAERPDILRKNSYRVLLTRGRDGLVIFVPEDAEMDDTYQTLQHAGAVEFGAI